METDGQTLGGQFPTTGKIELMLIHILISQPSPTSCPTSLLAGVVSSNSTTCQQFHKLIIVSGITIPIHKYLSVHECSLIEYRGMFTLEVVTNKLDNGCCVGSDWT